MRLHIITSLVLLAAFTGGCEKKVVVPPGFTKTPSGLMYKILKEGTGDSPKASSTVKVHYKGTLKDGSVFDSSYGKPPISFPVNGVIKGWQEALQMMKPGAKWQLIIPADLAYGDKGQGTIPPGATLHFDVELLDVSSE